MKRIAPEPKDSSPLTSDQLVRLAHFLSGRVHLECPNCGLFQRFTVGGGELRLGSSPDLSVLNPAHTSKPRLLFYCSRCRRRMVVQVLPTGWTARCSEHGTRTG